MKKLLPALFCSGLSLTAIADSNLHRVFLKSVGTNTFYVDSHIQGFGETALLVDTGSGYSTINRNTLKQLLKKGHATFIRTLEGVMANGTRSIVPLYRISAIHLGGKCKLDDIEVAVFPTGAKEILGLNALKKLSPFIFSMDPPSLTLSCSSKTADSNNRPPEKLAQRDNSDNLN